MKSKYLIDTIDTHTAGEPTRIVIGGLDLYSFFGRSIGEQRDIFSERYDDIRVLLMKEPRGHDDMFGAVPVKPMKEEADIGVIFMHTTGYLDMCGHGTIGVVTALLETGVLQVKDKIIIETPAGLVETLPKMKGDKVEKVSMKNVDSFILGRKRVRLEKLKKNIFVDIAYSGNLVGLVDVKSVGHSIKKEELGILKQLGTELMNRLNDENKFLHPIENYEKRVDLIEFYESREDVDRNIVVFADGSIDRSPCGTGTCAKMTFLHDKGELAVNEEYRYQSVLGTEFSGRILSAEEKEGVIVIKPEISGSAYITGKNTFILDPEDPLTGFSLYK